MKETKITTLQDLERIAMSSNMAIYYKDSLDRTLLFSPIIEKNIDKCYEINNSVLAFVDNHTLYFLPIFQTATDILIEDGFIHKSLYVPFSSGREKPLSYQWDFLVSYAKEQHLKDFEKDCKKFSFEHHFGAISENLLTKCLKIPECGIEVQHIYWNKTIYPELCGCIDCVAIDKIGHFNINNGVCIFVYCDGNTYVTRNLDVINALKCNGYETYNFFVPFSNGEIIKDVVYAQKWNCISKM